MTSRSDPREMKPPDYDQSTLLLPFADAPSIGMIARVFKT